MQREQNSLSASFWQQAACINHDKSNLAPHENHHQIDWVLYKYKISRLIYTGMLK